MSLTTWTPPTPTSETHGSPSEHARKPSTPKRRGRIACLTCRKRKVRCDISTGSAPCTNCRLDQVECMVAQNSRRLKQRTKGRAVAREPVLPSKEWLHWEQTKSGPDDCFHWWSIDTGNQQTCSSKSLSTPTQTDAATPPESWSHVQRKNRADQQTADNFIKKNLIRRVRSSIASMKEFDGGWYNSFQCKKGSLGGDRSSDDEQRGSLVLPPYILPCRQKLSKRTISCLRDQGAFVMPEGHLRDSLIHTYVQFVYPHLPVIDIADFANAMTRSDGSSKVSLLVLQAIYYSATEYVSIDVLTASGFPSRTSARKIFFERAKNLYNSAFEADTIKVVQALLHMSSWTEDIPSGRDSRALSTVAIELARNARIQYSLCSSTLSIQDQRTWRRTWWCCVVRDHLIKLGLEAPSIGMHESGMSMLEIADFKLSQSLPDPGDEEDMFHLIRDGVRRAQLAKSCIAMARLCTIEIPQGPRQGWGSGTQGPTSLRGTGSNPDLAALIRADKNLEAWASDFDQQIQYFMTDSLERYCDNKVIVLQQGILYSLYFALVSNLHRASHNSTAEISLTFGKAGGISLQKSRAAGRSITSIYHRILEMDLMQFLPHTVVNILAEASTVHLLDVSSECLRLRREGTRHLRSSALALRCLSDLYPIAGSVYGAALKTLSRLNAGLPLSRRWPVPQEIEDTMEESGSQQPEILPKPINSEDCKHSPMMDSLIDEGCLWATSVGPSWKQELDYCDSNPSSVNTTPIASSEAGNASPDDDVADYWQIIFDELVDMGEI